MFGSRYPPIEIFAVSADLGMARMQIAASVTEPVLELIDARLQFEGKFGLGALDDEVGKNPAQECCSFLAAEDPREYDAVVRIAQIMSVVVEAATVGLVQCLDEGPMGHADADVEGPSDVNAVRLLPPGDADQTFTVEQAGNVGILQHGATPNSAGTLA